MNVEDRIEEALETNLEKAEEEIIDFIREKVEEAGADGVVIGLSGGLDSATVSFLSAEAIGGNNVINISLPERGITSEKSRKDARKVSDSIGSEFEEIEINPLIENMRKMLDYDENAQIANENLKPRTRTVILYYYANKLNYLVVGASNKSELKTGYFTKYGDGAADILPIGNLYKTQEKKLAEKIGVPKQIIEKTPTAELKKNQKDRDDLGLPYNKIDRLYTGLELGHEIGEIADALGLEKKTITEFKNREEKTRHKRRRPPMPNL